MASSERTAFLAASLPMVLPQGPSRSRASHGPARRKTSTSTSAAAQDLPRQCSVSTCRRNIPRDWKHKTCEKCYERGRRSRERRRLRTVLEQALESDLQPVTCTICTQAIPMPPSLTGPARRQQSQFVLCASCQGKILSANALPSHRPRAVPRSTLVPGTPPAIHIVSGPDFVSQAPTPTPMPIEKTRSVQNRAEKAPSGDASRKRGVRVDADADSASRTKALGAGVSAPIPAPVSMPMLLPLSAPRAPAQAPRAIVTGRPFFDLERTIARLMQEPHLNERGEYVHPQFLPQLPRTSAGIVKTETEVSAQTPLSEGFVEALFESKPKPEPFVQVQVPPSLGTSSILPMDLAPRPASTSASRARERKPPTIRIPPRPAQIQIQSHLPTPITSTPLSAPSPFPSFSSSSPSLSSPSATFPQSPASPAVRICRKSGCNAVLSPRHVWIFCNRCLNIKDQDSSRHTEEKEAAGDKDRERRRKSAPALTSADAKGTWNVEPVLRRASEASAAGLILIPSMDTTAPLAFESKRVTHPPLEPSSVTDDTDDHTNALLTPPPSARVGKQTQARTEASSSPRRKGTAPSVFDAPPSPVSPGDEDNIHEDLVHDALGSESSEHLSDLTPLEDSSDDEDEDEMDVLDIVRKRVAFARHEAQPKSQSLNDTTSSIRIPATLPAPDSNASYVCRENKCQNLIPPRSKWKTCQPCRRRYREYCRRRSASAPKWMKQDLEDDDARSENEIMVSPEGHRKCTIRTCHNIIPPVAEYRWKMCEPCRTRTRRNARKRKHGFVGVSDDERENKGAGGTYEVKFKKLKLLFKGVPVASVEAAEQSHKQLQKQNQTSGVLGAVVQPAHFAASGQALVSYQTFEHLLHAFRDRFAGFVTAQIQYLRFKLAQSQLQLRPQIQSPGESKLGDTSKPLLDVDTKPMRFAFDGEFSVVADPAGGEVASRIQLVQGSVADFLGIDFGVRAPQYRVEPDGCIAGCFGCICDVLVPLPVPDGENAKAENMSGLGKVEGTDKAEEAGGAEEAEKEKCKHGGETASLEDAARVDSKDGDGKEKEQKRQATEHSAREKEHPKVENAGPDSQTDMTVKRMSGELEVSVTWDRTHRFFPGLRTVVHFRMVG